MKENKEKMSEQDSEGMNRGDFLKVVGATGLGIAGLSALASIPVSAEEGSPIRALSPATPSPVAPTTLRKSPLFIPFESCSDIFSFFSFIVIRLCYFQ